MAFSRIALVLVGNLFLVAAGFVQSAQAQNWDGSGLVRFGVFLQGSSVDFDINRMPATGTAIRQSASPDGFGVGVAGGYDLRLGSFLVGAEADISFDTGTDKPLKSGIDQYSVDYFGTVRGRLGVFATPAMLLYATGGWGLLGAEFKQSGVGGTATTAATSGNKRNATLTGFVVGGGLEYDIGWGTAFVEYLHTDFDTWSFRDFGTNALAVEASSDVVRVGLKFKVGHDYGHDVYRRPEGLK